MAETEVEAIMHRRVDEWNAEIDRKNEKIQQAADLATAQRRHDDYAKRVRTGRHTRMLTLDTATLRTALRNPNCSLYRVTRYVPWATCSPLNVAVGGLV